MKVYIDSSAYLSVLMLHDPNNKKAVEILRLILRNKEELVTSYAVIGEILTVSSQKYDRDKGISYVENIIESGIEIVLESTDLLKRAFRIFGEIGDKDVGWVDCYSFAIIEAHKIEKAFSFDRDFKRYAKVKILGS